MPESSSFPLPHVRAQEALLRRLSLTPLARDLLVLKGSFLTRAWARRHLDLERPAADLDFEALYPYSSSNDSLAAADGVKKSSSSAEERTRSLWTACCDAKDVADGCTVALLSCQATRVDFPVPHSHGCFSTFSVMIGDDVNEVVQLHVDVGWGDPIFPGPVEFHYKTTNDDDETVELRAVPMEMQFAWKFAALFKHNRRGEASGRIHQTSWASKDLWDILLLARTKQMNSHEIRTCLNVAFYSLSSETVPLDVRWLGRITNRTLGSSRKSATAWNDFRSTQPGATAAALPQHVHEAVQEIGDYLRPILRDLPQVEADEQWASYAETFGRDVDAAPQLADLSVWSNPRQTHAFLVAEDECDEDPRELLKPGTKIRIGCRPHVFVVQKRVKPFTEDWRPHGRLLKMGIPKEHAYQLVLDPPTPFASYAEDLFLVDRPTEDMTHQTKVEETPFSSIKEVISAPTRNKELTEKTPIKTDTLDPVQPIKLDLDDLDQQILEAKVIMKHVQKSPGPQPPRKGKRVIFVISSSAAKVQEFRSFFERYGIAVAHVSPYGFRTRGKSLARTAEILAPLAAQLLALGDGRTFWTKAVMWESMHFLRWDDQGHHYIDDPVDGERALVRANLIAWTFQTSMAGGEREMASVGLHHLGKYETRETPAPSKGGVVNAQASIKPCFYSNDVEGFIDLSRRSSSPDVFGFDDIFVVKATNLSYYEKKLNGFKCSPRDSNLSQFVSAHVHYKNRKFWSHLSSTVVPRPKERTISIGYDDGLACLRFVENNLHLNQGATARLLPFFYSVVNDGCFFRSAISRREINYWAPGLNAGIPFVAKKDEIHELTFFVHDISHFLLPDLVFTGTHSPQLRKVYIVARMLSEAVTLVFADMLFVESLRRSGVQYDWTQRAIWPLLAATGIDPLTAFPESESAQMAFKKLVHANVLYCLLGDDSGFRTLLSNCEDGKGTPDVLTRFKEKYMPFFVEDYRWTSHNYDDMASRSEEFRRWWDLVHPIRDALATAPGGCQLQTVEECASVIGADTLDGRELVLRCFEYLFETKIAPVFRRPAVAASEGMIRRNSLGRYMIGQLHLTCRFPMIPETKLYQRKLVTVMKALVAKNGVTLSECRAVRGLYDQFTEILEEKGMITLDDAVTYKEVCPLFEPCYVDYDKGIDFYDQLKGVYKAIIGEEASCSKEEVAISTQDSAALCSQVISGVRFIDMEKLWSVLGDVPLKSRLKALMGSAGVVFWEGTNHSCIKTPTAAVCSFGGIPVSLSVSSMGSVSLAGSEISIQNLIQAWRGGMGLASMPCYMNPGRKTGSQMWHVLCRHGHFSVGHTVTLSFFIAGFSCGVENELNSQRDLVHMSRITVARTAAQQEPPIVVQHHKLLPFVQQLCSLTKNSMPEKDPDASKADWYESVNLMWPAAKAQCAILTGSLRNFQKLVAAIDDDGKENEYRSLLLRINNSLHALQPEMFQPSTAYSFVPYHGAADDGLS